MTYSIYPTYGSNNLYENAGSITFTVVRSNPYSYETLYVSTYQSYGFTNSNDYQGQLETPIAFIYGQSAATITIYVNNDSLAESNETFGLIVQSPARQTVASSYFTVVNDDVLAVPPQIRVSDAGTSEGGYLNFTVSLDRPADRDVYVYYATYIGTANNGDSDYSGVGSASVLIRAGQTAANVSIQTYQDSKAESDETMQLVLTGASYGSIKRRRWRTC